MGLIVFMSIFVKILYAEIPDISIKSEIIHFKQWLDPVLLFFILFNIVDNKETCDRSFIRFVFFIITIHFNTTFCNIRFNKLQSRTINISIQGRAGGFGAAGEYAISLVLLFPFFYQ